MAPKSDNDRLLDEILNETASGAPKRPARRPEAPAPRPVRQEPYQPRYAREESTAEVNLPEEAYSDEELEEAVREFSEEGREQRREAAQQQRTQRPAPRRSAPERPAPKAAAKKKKKKKKHSSGRIFGVLIMLTLIFVISITLSIGIIEVGKDLLGVNGTETLVPFNIPEGATTAEIAEDLYEAGIIEYPKAFVYFSRLSGSDTGYVAGDHEVSSIMAYETIINELTGLAEDDRVSVNVMFPEGITLHEAAKKLEEAGVCEADRFIYFFNTGSYGYDFESRLPTTLSKLKFNRMEGYLFPDTYTFYEEMEPADVCRKIYMNFNVKMTDEKYARMNELGLTLDELVTLASIVQAEAGSKAVMKDVSSVFWNRLNDPDTFPMLQSDPTSKYVEEIIKPNIALQDELVFNAYDTYICSGLPAGAIGNPGMDAIDAVLYPNDTNYYYFYANVETGITYFAETLEEHYENEQMIKDQQAAAAAGEGEE
ncbi:MAG: endolytic transglycosylase MltG [Ruminococcus sp.]|nr:endolytic transglycosylase MltG [Ruminococcus sp.]